MLKTTMSSQVLAANEILGARVLSANEVGDIEGGEGLKRVKSKTGRSESQKLSKSRKSAKSRKKLSKRRNSPNFDTKEPGPNFLTPGAREIFNRLRLAFIEALIFWHFDPECYI